MKDAEARYTEKEMSHKKGQGRIIQSSHRIRLGFLAA
jgi:hypothetical protein